MAKFSVSSLTKHKPSKRTVYIAVAVAVLAVLFIIGMVAQVRNERVRKARQAAIAAEYNDLKHENAALKAQTSELQDKLVASRTAQTSTCDWVKSVAPRYRITVPPLCKTN